MIRHILNSLPNILIFVVSLPGSYSQQTSPDRHMFGFTLDFEEGMTIGWLRNNDNTSNAFYNQPTFGDNPTARQ